MTHIPKGGMYVEILSYETDEVIKRLGPYSRDRQAGKAEIGVGLNLDAEKYYTRVVTE